MKKFTLFAVVSAFLLTVQAVEIDGIAATVGTQTILRSAVRDGLRRAGLDESKFDDMRNNLIERELILKAAQDSKLTLQEWVVDNRIKEIIDNGFEGDRNKLITMLTAQKLPYPEWRQRIKEDLIISAMRWNTITKNVSASPADVRVEYQKHPERYQKESQVSVSVLMVKPGEEKPATFEDSKAKKYQDVVAKEMFHPAIEDVVRKLKKGKVSPWIEVDGWHYRIRKDDEKRSKTLSFTDAYDEIVENVTNEKSEKLYKAWMDRLKEETYIKVY